MKYHNIQRIWNDPIYARFKKHYCPKCGELMVISKRDAILTPEQAQSRNLHPDAIGKTKFVWNVLECPGCGLTKTIPEMKQLEKKKC